MLLYCPTSLQSSALKIVSQLCTKKETEKEVMPQVPTSWGHGADGLSAWRPHTGKLCVQREASACETSQYHLHQLSVNKNLF